MIARRPLLCLFGCLSLVLLVTSCFSPDPYEPLKLKGSLRLNFVPAPGKSIGCLDPKKPCAVPRTPIRLKMKITALDKDNKPDSSFNGKVCLYSSRGILDRGLIKTKEPIALKNGVSDEFTFNLRLTFGRTSIWAGSSTRSTDGKTFVCPDASDPGDTTRPYIGRAGSAPDLYFKNLSIRDVQETARKGLDSPLLNKYCVISEGKMVVTAVTSNGFYVTDLEEYKRTQQYHSMFVFTFSAPTLAHEEGVEPRLLQVGDIVDRVEGGVDEFSGHTQLTFPSYVPRWKEGKKDEEVQQVDPKDLPKPIRLTSDLVWSRSKMEPLESALVEAKDAIALPFDLNQEGWQQFRQWPFLVIEANEASKKAACENMVRTELQLHTDKSKNNNSTYRKCLDACYDKRLIAEKKCKADDEECKRNAVDSWYSCFFQTCRFDRGKGLFARLDAQGCKHSILMAITSSTVPDYNPTDPQHVKQRFTHIRGVLQQVKATSYYKLFDKQYPDELSNNGFIIWVRNPDDLKLDNRALSKP